MSNFDAVLMAIVFLLPGFIILSIKRSLYPNREVSTLDSLYSCLGMSLLVFVSLIWLLPELKKLYRSNDFINLIIWLFIAEAVASIFWTLIILFVEEKQLIYKAACRLGLNPAAPEPDAWTYQFSKRKSCYLMVHLKDNTVIYGWYGENSFVSTTPGNKDMFIEKVYNVDPEKWKEIKDLSGVYINADEIAFIEFMNV